MSNSTLFGGTLHTALVHAATQYDIRQARGKRYNPYALAQYLMRIDEVEQDIKAGADPRQAICAAFTGTLLNAMLKAIGATAPTRDELTGAGKSWTYQPVKG